MEVANGVVNMCPPVTPWCSQPSTVIVPNVLGDGCTGNNMVTWSLQRTSKRDENVKMIFREERLTLVVKHPDVARLAGLALNGYGTFRCGIRSENINASGIAKGDRSDVSTPGQLGCDEILTSNTCEQWGNLGIGWLGFRFHRIQATTNSELDHSILTPSTPAPTSSSPSPSRCACPR